MDRYDITIQMLGVEASGPQYVWEKVPAEEGELVLYTDAQATIVALQARVQELEQWVQDQSTANLETMRHTDEMQSRAMEAEQQLTQRTAELEAAKAIQAIDMKNNNAYREQVANLQAELERVRDQFADLRKMVAALPKVEGEITEDSSDHGGEIRDGNGYVHYYATSRAKVRALLQVLQHRQGMEG